MDQNNGWKRTRSTIHKSNMKKMKQFRKLASTYEEFLSFRHGFLEQVKLKFLFTILGYW